MSMIKLIRAKYGSVPLERDNDGYFTCFFRGCCQKIAGDWTEHLKGHEIAGDVIDYTIFITQPTAVPSDFTGAGSTTHISYNNKRYPAQATGAHPCDQCPHDSFSHSLLSPKRPIQQQQQQQQQEATTGHRKQVSKTFDKLLEGGNKALQDVPVALRASEGLMRKNVHSFYQFGAEATFGDFRREPERVSQRVTELYVRGYSPLGPSWANYPPPPYAQSQHAAANLGECSLPQECYPAQSFLGTGDLAPPPVYAVAEQDVSTLTDPGAPFFVAAHDVVTKLENFITENSQEFSGPEEFQFKLASVVTSLESGKYKFVKDVADSLAGIWGPLVDANGQHSQAVAASIKEIRDLLDALCAKEREKVDERVREDESSCNFTPNDTCAICRKGGDLFFCSGACHRCYHVECLGNLETAFSTNHICPQCFHGKPVLHYDTKKNGFCFFSYRRRRSDPAGFGELERKVSENLLPNAERKNTLRKECEESRINTMYYDPVWCTWRSKSDRHTRERYNATTTTSPLHENKINDLETTTTTTTTTTSEQLQTIHPPPPSNHQQQQEQEEEQLPQPPPQKIPKMN